MERLTTKTDIGYATKTYKMDIVKKLGAYEDIDPDPGEVMKKAEYVPDKRYSWYDENTIRKFLRLHPDWRVLSEEKPKRPCVCRILYKDASDGWVSAMATWVTPACSFSKSCFKGASPFFFGVDVSDVYAWKEIRP